MGIKKTSKTEITDTFESTSKSLEENMRNILKYNNIKIVGYITTPAIVGFFILLHSKKKIKELEDLKAKLIFDLENAITAEVNKIGQQYKNIIKVDTYLIYNDKSKIIQNINSLSSILINWIKEEQKLPTELTETIKKSNIDVQKIKQNIIEYNSKFIIQRKIKYGLLFKNEEISLDENQQNAIVTDDKYNLVIAGAGSGKTEVLTTRIAYLVKREPDTIKPDRILALAFQNKAAKEIKERLKNRYEINDVDVRTFHSLGKKVIENANNNAPELKPECSEEWKFNNYIKKLFDKLLINDQNLQNELIDFLEYYGDSEIPKEEVDFEEKEEFYEYKRQLIYTSLNGTKVKSASEREILNFFLTHNLNGKKINVIYEHPAQWMTYKTKEGKEYTPKPDFYFPDFDVYLEHWSIGKKGEVPEWYSGKDATSEYIEHMNLKKKQFKENKKTLIETSQKDFEDNQINKVLEKKLITALNQKFPEQEFEMASLNYKEIVERVWDECKEFIKSIDINLARFIVIAKTYSLNPNDIEERLKKEKWSLKQKSFAKIACTVYREYEKELRNSNQIDFSDMINLAVKELKSNNKLYTDIYDHILIDEYQDVSTQRYELIKILLEKNPNCKLFCVGDDWQSIMGFAGSNLDFFINFGKYFEHPAVTDLPKNYRSIKSIVDAGASIIKNNKDGQIQKETTANNDESKPIMVYVSQHKKTYYDKYYKQVAEHCLDKIKEYYSKGGYSYGDFLILLRITQKPLLRNFITRYAKQLKIPISEEFNNPNCVHLMSVHKSKGLQARVVLILNVDHGMYGFPCELDTPEIFEPAIKNNDGFRDQEERRLFYVSVTRAKEEIIIYTQKHTESKFITEIDDFIKKEYLNY